MYRYRVFNADTGEYIETITANCPFKAVGERVGSVIIGGREAPGSITKIDNSSESEGVLQIDGSVWVKQDAYE